MREPSMRLGALPTLLLAALLVPWPASAQTPAIPDELAEPPTERSPEPAANEPSPNEPTPTAAPAAGGPDRVAAATGSPERGATARNAQSYSGETGLLRIASAQGARARTIRLGFGLDFFAASGVFREGDSASRVGG